MSIRKVVDGGLCIGCGACTAVAPRIRVVFNAHGDLVAQVPDDLSADDEAGASAVCPFVDGEDETEMGRRLFAAPTARWHDEIGSYVGTHGAYAPSHRSRGSSGGVATWLLTRLLERGLIDYAIHVAPQGNDNSDGRRFAFRVSDNVDDIEAGATSFYYPVSLDAVLQIVKERPGRYAVTGVPCFHKALRRLRAVDPMLDERVRYQIGIVCGQMKSAHYLDYLLGIAGAPAGELQQACFRRKVSGHLASDYAFEAVVETPAGSRMVKAMNSQIGLNWGMGYFKPLACEVCDDVLAETADIAAMDAWLPRFVNDGDAWSLVVTRTPEIEREVREAANEGALVLAAVNATDVADSQRGGLNHRRVALPYRLWMHRRRWLPGKRSAPSPTLAWPIRLEQRMRERLRKRSRELWLTTGARGDFAAFARGMRWPETIYRWIARIKRLAL